MQAKIFEVVKIILYNCIVLLQVNHRYSYRDAETANC